MFNEDFFKPYYRMLEGCKNVKDDYTGHKESSVYEHSFQCLKIALKETDDIDLIIATWCHDTGKQVSIKEHPLYVSPDFFSEKSFWLISNHMRIHEYLSGHTKKLSKIKKLTEHPWFPELIQLSRFDKMGREDKDSFIPIEELVVIMNKKILKHFR